MGIQINGSTDRITAIDGTIDFVSNIGNIGLITASNYVLQDSITIGAGSTVIKTVNGKLLLGTTSVGNASAYYDNLIISNTTSGEGSGITLFANATNGYSAIDFGDTAAVGRGRITYSHGDDDLRVDAGGSEALRIDSSGRVLIGTTTEGYASADDLTVATTGNTGITIRSSTGGLGTLAFSDGTSGAAEYDGYIQYSQADQYMDFGGAGGNIRLRIDSLGNLLVGTTTEGNTNTQITVADSGNAGITIRSGTSNWGVLYFSDATSGADEYRGAVQYNQTSDYLMFRTASAERLRINSVGNVSIGGADPLPHHTGYNGATLHLYQSGSSNVGGELRFTTGASGHTVSDGGYIAYWTDNNMYCNIKESGNWIFYTANTERLRIHSDGKISTKGITNPQGVFCVDTGSGATQGNTLELRRDSTSDYHAVSFFTGSTCDWSVGQNNAGSFDVYENGSDATTRLEVREGGDVKVNSGDLIIGTSGKGINFSATDNSSAGSSINELLDDYEEGQFTPTIGTHSNINSTSGIDSSHNGSGSYTKIGNMVTVTVDFNNLHGNARDHVLRYITGLPFTSASNNKTTAAIGYQRGLRFVYSNDVFDGESGRYHHLYGHIGGSTTQMDLNGSMSYSPYSGWPCTHDSASSQYLRITINYFTPT